MAIYATPLAGPAGTLVKLAAIVVHARGAYRAATGATDNQSASRTLRAWSLLSLAVLLESVVPWLPSVIPFGLDVRLWLYIYIAVARDPAAAHFAAPSTPLLRAVAAATPALARGAAGVATLIHTTLVPILIGVLPARTLEAAGARWGGGASSSATAAAQPSSSSSGGGGGGGLLSALSSMFSGGGSSSSSNGGSGAAASVPSSSRRGGGGRASRRASDTSLLGRRGAAAAAADDEED